MGWVHGTPQKVKIILKFEKYVWAKKYENRYIIIGNLYIVNIQNYLCLCYWQLETCDSLQEQFETKNAICSHSKWIGQKCSFQTELPIVTLAHQFLPGTQKVKKRKDYKYSTFT